MAGCAFSILVAVAALYASFALLWITATIFRIMLLIQGLCGHQTKTRLRPVIARRGVMIFSGFLFSYMALIVVDAAWRHPIPIGLLEWALMSGFVVDCMIVTEPTVASLEGSVWRKWFWLIPLMPVLLLFWGTGAFSYLLDRAMINLSFRSEPDQFISVSDPSYKKVDALAHLGGIQLSSCMIGKDSWLLPGATLVWHGIGSTSYLRITGKSGVSLLIPVPSSDVGAIYAVSPEAVDCGKPSQANPS